jgi:hypothetical protein
MSPNKPQVSFRQNQSGSKTCGKRCSNPNNKAGPVAALTVFQVWDNPVLKIKLLIK